MKAPKPTKKTFPPSWKKWRCLKAGETLRASDRVVLREVKNRRVMKMYSANLGDHHVGVVVSDATCPAYPAGWYFRKVS